MLISPETIIKTICPELFGSPSLQVYLGMAVERVDRGFFRHAYDQAVAYRACHIFTVLNPSGAGGGIAGSDELMKLGGGAPVSSISEGGLSVSFAQSAGRADLEDLATTKYGRMYLELKKGMPRMGVNRAGGILG